MLRKDHARQSWQAYQVSLKRSATNKKLAHNILKYSPLMSLVAFIIYGIVAGISGSACLHKQTDNHSLSPEKDSVFSKQKIREILDENVFVNLDNESFQLENSGLKYNIDTSLNIPLQDLILKKMDRKNSRYIGFVAMEPSTGKVLSMASFDKTDSLENPCINSKFPAASIFKIVTAAAAVEKCGFTPSSKLMYNGKKYTLYKTQLKDRVNRYTNNITFRNSFAQSVNPVFGKIGANYLGKETLEKYANLFGFNRSIEFEIPLLPSHVSLSEDSYQWAEIACGFNNETKMSPLHGALLSSVILNQGELIEPTIINRITDESGKIVYNSSINTVNHAISPDTSMVVYDLMKSTISSGTCRKSFRGYKKDRILSKLTIGGKTGSINNRTNDVRYDWFVGFAQDKSGLGEIVIAVVVAHEKYIGKRASYYGRLAMKAYFEDYFTQNKSQT